MGASECSCSYERVYAVEIRNIREDLQELKARVGRLEATIARGVLLLVANLVGVVMTFAQQLL